MSTNFYADWNVNENVTVHLHIGKRTNGRISTYQGEVFPTLEAWKTFLTHNINNVTIRSEYNEIVPVPDFIRDEIDIKPAPREQSNWLLDNGYVIHDQPVPAGEGKTAYWFDGDALFYNGEFS